MREDMPTYPVAIRSAKNVKTALACLRRFPHAKAQIGLNQCILTMITPQAQKQPARDLGVFAHQGRGVLNFPQPVNDTFLGGHPPRAGSRRGQNRARRQAQISPVQGVFKGSFAPHCDPELDQKGSPKCLSTVMASPPQNSEIIKENMDSAP
jgi:hypothetical protein